MASTEVTKKKKRTRRGTMQLENDHNVNQLLSELVLSSESQSQSESKTLSSSNSASKIEESTSDASNLKKLNIVCTARFKYKPFGFSVVHDPNDLNCVVTKVTSPACFKLNIKIGYVVATVNDKFVYDKPHIDVLQALQSAQLPCVIRFIDV